MFWLGLLCGFVLALVAAAIGAPSRSGHAGLMDEE